ncbi:MAG: MBL fold metallo-hydrolase, partial [Thermoleophilaceae bacterium]
MLFRQITHEDLGCASYLVGDEGAGVAAVVDPRLDIGEYLRLARYSGVHIEHILETHNHADHVSGHGRLAAATGATIHIHREAAAEYDHEPFDDGWELRLGEVTVRALHTPGHRPEHTAFALFDSQRGDEPWAVLTGDSLFVGDIARPDLAVDKDEGARGIFHSLRGRLLTLPATVEIWPGHLGGSLCGGPGMDMKGSSTIGYEREHSELLGIDQEDEFVRRTTAALRPQPPNFEAIVVRNRGPLAIESAEVHPLTPRQVEQARRDDALVVDVRTELQFDEAHITDAVSITERRAGFGSKLAWLVEPEQRVVLVGRDDEDALHAADLAASVGITRIAGFLAGGMTSWREERLPVERIERITVSELRGLAGEVQILDVRERNEWDAGHIRGSVHTPYHDIHAIPEGIDPGRPVAVIC